MVFNKRIGEITAGDVLRLVENNVREGFFNDYKRQLPNLHSDEESRKFLADVVSFANARGGFLIYGVEEVPDGDNKVLKLFGIRKLQQKEIDAMRDKIRWCIEPQIPPVDFQPLDDVDGHTVLILWVPPSYAAPHGAKLGKGTYTFKSRHGDGNFPMDIHDLRAAFLASASLEEKILATHRDRRGRLKPISVPNGGPEVMLHVIPVSAFRVGGEALDPSLIPPHQQRLAQPFLYYEGHAVQGRYTFDGYLTWGGPSYAHFMRNGMIEAFDKLSLIDEQKKVAWFPFGKDLLDAVDRYTQLLQLLQFPPPWVVVVSLVGVKDLRVTLRDPYRPGQKGTIESNELEFPLILINERGKPALAHLAPLLHQLWQAAGQADCPHVVNDEWKAVES